MNPLLVTSILSLVIFTSSQLAATRNYIIPTGNDNIMCTLTTLTKNECAKLTGSPCTAYQNVGYYQTGNYMQPIDVPVSTEQPYERFMAVRVKIKNNSTQAIILKKDQYFDFMTLKKAFASKEDLLQLYPWFTARFIAWTISAAFFGCCSIACLMQKENGAWLIAAFFTLMEALALLAMHSDAQLYKHYTTIQNSSPGIDSDTFIIHPGKTANDLFFIDLKKGADYDFFEKEKVTLLYEAAPIK